MVLTRTASIELEEIVLPTIENVTPFAVIARMALFSVDPPMLTVLVAKFVKPRFPFIVVPVTNKDTLVNVFPFMFVLTVEVTRLIVLEVRLDKTTLVNTVQDVSTTVTPLELVTERWYRLQVEICTVTPFAPLTLIEFTWTLLMLIVKPLP